MLTILIDIFKYSLGVSITMLMLWAVYRLTFAKNKHHALTRGVLIAIYAVSVILPALLMKAVDAFSAPAGDALTSGGGGDIVVIGVRTTISNRVMQLPAFIWIAGMTIVATLTLLEILKVAKIVKRANSEELDGTEVMVTDDNRVTAFSFGGKIVINRKFAETCDETVLIHEKAHRRYHHTADMLPAQLLTILCWYNPAAWMMRRELRAVHEYQADRDVVGTGIDPQAYQMMLIRESVGKMMPQLVNSLAHTELRRRISMMNRPADSSRHLVAGCVAITIALALASKLLLTPEIRALWEPVMLPANAVEYTAPIEYTGTVEYTTTGEFNTDESQPDGINVIAHTGTARDEYPPSEEMMLTVDNMRMPASILKDMHPAVIRQLVVDRQSNTVKVYTKKESRE